MNKNIFTLLLLLLSILIVLYIPNNTKQTSPLTTIEPIIETPVPSTFPTTSPLSVSLDSTLFIGDSRTVGIMEYGNLNEANFFCDVGMSVFNIFDKTISMPSIGRLTLNELLANKQYKTIYIMLGLNEMGYEFTSIINKYQELLSYIQNINPDAHIIMLGNLHVTNDKDSSDPIFNNTNIDNLNNSIATLSNNINIFYIDTNYLFDDNGALASDKSADNIHLYAKHYEEWGNWIIEETNKLVKEE